MAARHVGARKSQRPTSRRDDRAIARSERTADCVRVPFPRRSGRESGGCGVVAANPRWVHRLKGVVTFGTSHEGAELAEFGDELLGKLLLLNAVHQKSNLVPLVNSLWTVHRRKKIEGITDLRPRANGGEFLYQWQKAETRQARRAGDRALPLFVVGGRALHGWLSRRFFGGKLSDLVVAPSSSTPASIQPSSETTTDHFSYFSEDETAATASSAAAEAALQSTAFSACGWRAGAFLSARVRPHDGASVRKSDRCQRGE